MNPINPPLWRVECHDGQTLNTIVFDPSGKELKYLKNILICIDVQNRDVEMIATQISGLVPVPNEIRVYGTPVLAPVILDLKLMQNTILKATQIPAKYLRG